MADPRKRLPLNVPGAFFVDSTCIDCDTCRQLAPDTFSDGGDWSYVHRQPETGDDRRAALRALVACPTGSIGGAPAKEAVSDFPMELEPGLYYCGFASPKSFGGSSYFLRHAGGNWLIDSPRYVEHLARRFEEMGGIAHIFLTHRDDVADAAKYAHRFGSRRVIHRLERSAQPDAETVLDGTDPIELEEDFLVIPTPGHTRGHCVLLHAGRLLFSGDHLWWSRNLRALNASRSVCWYSWPEQAQSMARLAGYSFEWVLPGHGERIRLPREQVREQMAALVQRMNAR